MWTPPLDSISLALLSRRDNHLLAATAKLAILCAARLAFRSNAANDHPDHDTIAAFRRSGGGFVSLRRGPPFQFCEKCDAAQLSRLYERG
jgi:hypothetical protein